MGALSKVLQHLYNIGIIVFLMNVKSFNHPVFPCLILIEPQYEYGKPAVANVGMTLKKMVEDIEPYLQGIFQGNVSSIDQVD